MTQVEVKDLQNALQSYQESLADLDTLRQTGQNLDDTQEVSLLNPLKANISETIVLQVYLELVEAIALTKDALHALQSTHPEEEDQKDSSSQQDEASIETPTHDLSQVCVTSS